MLELWEDMRGDQEFTYRRVLSGSMGVGKSYLSYFLASKAYSEGWLVLYMSDAGLLDKNKQDESALEDATHVAGSEDAVAYRRAWKVVRKELHVTDKFKSLVPLKSYHWWGEEPKGSRVVFTGIAHAKYEMNILDESYRPKSVVFVGPLSRDVFSKLLDAYSKWPSDDHNKFHMEWASSHVAEEVSKSLRDATWKSILKSLVVDTDKAAMEVMFKPMCVTSFERVAARSKSRIFKMGRLRLSTSRLIQRRNDHGACSKLPYPRNTISRDHPSQPFLTALLSKSGLPPLLIFVVPSEIYDGFFQAQKYLTSAVNVYEKVPKQIQGVRQFVLKIDLHSGATGHSLGIRGSAY
ncbi:hypothetical protein BGZ96_010027 [Linnemannia gamsii]|uniref:Uncharacterized protein n=1 Tax=Linnemannia gamsii TaxID=64522 RepID=A0ABQ7JWZ4_9FUNG|nr:hypothetical protein BGZ96_010027 [Linnemannia gamsii]